MGWFGKIFIIVVAGLIALSLKCYRDHLGPLPKPEFDSKFYWGKGDADKYKEDNSIRSFKINYDETVINKLKNQLMDTSFLRDTMEGVNFEYGMNTKSLNQIVKYWRDDYLSKWEQHQNYLNKYPQFKTQIQGLDMYFIHIKADAKPGKKSYPLLLLHGWPGSVVEFYEAIEILKNNKDFNFDIVVPSLPGYGFSQAASKTGLSASSVSVIMRNLMIRLGYNKFIIQGGDWGSIIGSNLATLYPENVIGYHSNMCGVLGPMTTIKNTIAGICPKHFIPEEFIDFVFPASNKFKYLIEETGYMHIQATKPDTIGAALSNNPIGLAAYILEKFSTWTNGEYKSLPDGGISKRYTMDNLIHNLMFYYLSNSITTSVRLYSETLNIKEMSLKLDRVPTTVPTGCARFKHDIMHSIDWVLKDKFRNLIQSTYYKDGGHFAAMEQPELLTTDFVEFIKKL